MKAKITVTALAFSALAAAMLTLAQSAPQFINYQGRLTNPSGQPLDGVTVDMTFAFYGAESGSTAYLSILQPNVLVTAGIYNVLLGSGTITPGSESTLASVFQNHTDVWMGIKVDAEAEMTPRQRITSVPYAIQSQNSSHASSVDYAALSAAIYNDPDHDNDGRNSILIAGGTDCNDNDPNAYPGAPEIICDGIDQNCDRFDPQYENTRITSGPGSKNYPYMSWTGSEFGVSWADDRDGDWEVFFARVSSDGSKIGTDMRITSQAGDSFQPYLSWTGSEFGMSWFDRRDGNDQIYFVRISATGNKIGNDERISSGGYASWDTYSLCWTGSEFGMSWGDYRDGNGEIYFARVSATGAKISTDMRITTATGESDVPSLYWTGSEYGLNWCDNRDGDYEIYFVRISASGSKIGADTRITSQAGVSFRSSLSWTGSEFGASWTDDRDGDMEIYFTRISASGSKIGADVRITSAVNASVYPFLFSTGSEFGVSWDDFRDGNDEIYFARLSSVGDKIGEDTRITSDVGGSWGASLSWTGSEFGVCWLDTRDMALEIYFTRIVSCP